MSQLELEVKSRELAEVLKAQVPEGCGFCLLLFNYGEHGKDSYLSWISTAEREDMLATVIEFLEVVGGQDKQAMANAITRRRVMRMGAEGS